MTRFSKPALLGLFVTVVGMAGDEEKAVTPHVQCDSAAFCSIRLRRRTVLRVAFKGRPRPSLGIVALSFFR